MDQFKTYVVLLYPSGSRSSTAQSNRPDMRNRGSERAGVLWGLHVRAPYHASRPGRAIVPGTRRTSSDATSPPPARFTASVVGCDGRIGVAAACGGWRRVHTRRGCGATWHVMHCGRQHARAQGRCGIPCPRYSALFGARATGFKSRGEVRLSSSAGGVVGDGNSRWREQGVPGSGG